jgi:eukaryotic-like serine/threonine-protein kinase
MRDAIVGDRIDQYELTQLLARSGMASIFKANDTLSGQVVVLKVPYFQFESDIVFHERFSREEKIGLRIDHPYVVKVLAPKYKTRVYLVMEFAEGLSLRAIMDGQRRCTPEFALNIACQVCEALVYIHHKGVIHRDLKPENVLVNAEGKVKIIDFGIAMDESARRLTWTGFSATLGTPTYMAPEQINGRRGDVRTDIYSLGVMLFEMVTGDLPFNDSNMHALMRAKTNEAPLAPSHFLPDMDPKLEEIILHAIERSPKDRYPAADIMLADLRNPAAVEPRARSQVRASAGAWERLPQSVKTGGIVFVVIAFLCLLIFNTSRRSPRPPSSQTPAGRVQ